MGNSSEVSLGKVGVGVLMDRLRVELVVVAVQRPQDGAAHSNAIRAYPNRGSSWTKI